MQLRALTELANAKPKKLARHIVTTTAPGELEWCEFKRRVFGGRRARYGYKWNEWSVAVNATVTEVSNLRRALTSMEKRGLVVWRRIQGIRDDGPGYPPQPMGWFSMYAITATGRGELNRISYVNLNEHDGSLGSHTEGAS
jgi:hypothetical protein